MAIIWLLWAGLLCCPAAAVTVATWRDVEISPCNKILEKNTLDEEMSQQIWDKENCDELFYMPSSFNTDLAHVINRTKSKEPMYKGWHQVATGTVGEPPAEMLHSRLSISRDNQEGIFKADAFLSVVASMESLELLRSVSPEQIVWFDLNPMALMYARMMVELIQISGSPAELMTYLFGRDLEKFEASHGKLTVGTQKRFLAMPKNPEIEQRALTELSEDAATAYQRLVQPFTTPNGKHNSTIMRFMRVYSLKPVSDKTSEQFSSCRSHVGMGGGFCRLREYLEDPEISHTSYFGYGDLWLSNRTEFTKVKDAVKRARHKYVNMNILDLESWESRCVDLKNTVMYVNDLFTNRITHMGLQEYRTSFTKDMSRRCGSNRMYFIEAWSWKRSHMCQKREQVSHWSSCSDWHSDSQLPAQFFVSNNQTDPLLAKKQGLKLLADADAMPATHDTLQLHASSDDLTPEEQEKQRNDLYATERAEEERQWQKAQAESAQETLKLKAHGALLIARESASNIFEDNSVMNMQAGNRNAEGTTINLDGKAAPFMGQLNSK